MDDDSEKLTALKKAYAEIILNTAKEAAARIMVSEQKSVRYQKELSAVKDDALQMLVRLKHMLDSKVSEAEKASLSQRKKIEELEAQLEEAEDIVRDLRAELQQVQDELEKVANKQLQTVMEQNLGGSCATKKQLTSDNRVDSSGSMLPLSSSKVEKVSTYEMHSTLNWTYDSNECNDANDSCMDNGCLHNSNFASIRMRSKEPDLYKNGCTQRIRALERNVLNENMCFSEETDDIKSGTLIRVDEEAKGMHLTPGHKASHICEDEKKMNIPKAVLMDNSNIRAHLLNPCSQKRKREEKYNTSKVPSIICHTGKATIDLYCSESFSADIIDQSENISSEIDKNGVEKNTFFSTAANNASETNGMITSLGIDTMRSDEAFVRPCNALSMKNDQEEVLDNLDLTVQESLSIESLDGHGCKTDVETVKEMLHSTDKKDSDLNDQILMESPNNKPLKYTFQRKRKKEHLNSPTGSTSLDEGMFDKENGEKLSSPLGSQKSISMTESPLDNRQLTQVARELVCLSEKKCWG